VNKGKLLGIEIGGTKLQIVGGDEAGTVVSAHRFSVDKAEGAAGIRKKIEETIKRHYTGSVTAVGVGFGGPVNAATGQIATSFHIDGWSAFALAKWLEPLAEAPVFVDNDANVAALGEATCGAGRGYTSVLYVTLGSGVGGGLVINRKIYHGAVPGEVEIGHIRMDRAGTTLQSLCSGWAVDQKIRDAIAGEPEGVLATLAGDRRAGEAALLGDALAARDAKAGEIFEQTTDDLAFGLSHAVHLLHPEMLILGGGLSLLGEVLRESVARKLPGYLMRAFAPGPPVKLAQLGEQAVPVGSLVLAHQKIQKQ
jgi:glucokinase